MELPEFHRKNETFWKIRQWLPGTDKYNSSPRVLWADGGAGIITMEEAEKLIKDRPPKSINFSSDSGIERERKTATDRQD